MLNYLSSIRNAEKDLWNDFFSPSFFTNNIVTSMRTDVKETENEYLLDVELPGYGKDEVKVSLDDGYLKIEAIKNSENNSDEKASFIRKERYYGSMSRSYYVGNIDKNNIKAVFKNGILTLTVPKQQLPEEDKTIYINVD